MSPGLAKLLYPTVEVYLRIQREILPLWGIIILRKIKA